jgi:alkanesulfonate monooxygenase SsuD/methylene tetrahydromethanopterin reductase-like flavin-dependent oxidoreductase (luciferase family)
MKVGVLLADMVQSMSARDQLDLSLRQVNWGQAVGMTYFMLAQHWMYDRITCLQPVPLAARLAAELEPHSYVGTAVMVGPAYHPVMLAEEAATLDLIADGRFILGLGNGYRDSEIAMLGIDPKERGRRLEELLTVLPRLWNEDSVTHRGRFWDFQDARKHIPNVRPAGPRVWVGAKSAVGVDRAARLSDGWISPSKIPFDLLPGLVKTFREARSRAGRGAGTIALMRQIVPGGSSEEALTRHYQMSQERLDAYEARDLNLKSGNAAGETRDANRTALLGTIDDILSRARWLAEECNAEILITRVAWLGLTPREIHEEYQRLAEAISAIAEIETASKLTR